MTLIASSIPANCGRSRSAHASPHRPAPSATPRVLQIKANFPRLPDPTVSRPSGISARSSRCRPRWPSANSNALVLLNAHNVVYTTGYFHLPTERPLAVLIPASGEPVLFVPDLESDQVKLWWVKDVRSRTSTIPVR